MHHIALVHHAANHVHEQRDHEDHGEHAPGAQGAFCIGTCCAAAHVSRAHFEPVRAVVEGADEGDGGVCGEQRGGVADEGEHAGFAPGGFGG